MLEFQISADHVYLDHSALQQRVDLMKNVKWMMRLL